MSFGKMRTFIEITQKQKVIDDEGFSEIKDVVLASVRAYWEDRHGSERWANMARFSDATDLFRFRVIPDVKVTRAMRIKCGERTFEILSVVDVKGKGMYIEVMAKEVEPSG